MDYAAAVKGLRGLNVKPKKADPPGPSPVRPRIVALKVSKRSKIIKVHNVVKAMKTAYGRTIMLHGPRKVEGGMSAVRTLRKFIERKEAWKKLMKASSVAIRLCEQLAEMYA